MTGNIMSILTKKILFTTKSFLLYNFMVVENEQKAFIRVIIASFVKEGSKEGVGFVLLDSNLYRNTIY